MTNLPAQINLYNLTFNTFGLFMLFGFILLAYVFWKEGKGDGFDEERLFDLLLISLISSLFFSRLFFAISAKISFLLVPTHIAKFWTPGHNMLGAFAGLILAIYILCKIWNWSVYRILDIFALGLSLGLSVILLGYVGLQAKFEFLFAFAAFIFLLF